MDTPIGSETNTGVSGLEMASGMKDARMMYDRTSEDYYFDSYAHFGIHEEMLKDEVRTRSYMDAIVKNKHLFKGKVVLDVGCGTGILSMFAAKAGASKVFGVDCSSIIDAARHIVEENNFSQTITLIKGKIEEVELPIDKVDIIISEWMGYMLLYESMLDSVLFARDKWLSADGLIFPDKASLYICAIEDSQYRAEKLDFWNNVYGFKMTSIRAIALREPLVDVVESHSVVTNSVKIKEIDIQTIKKEDLEFNSGFELVAQRSDYIHAFVCYFDIAFSHSHVPVRFSTGPFAPYTHWKQSVFYFEESIPMNAQEKVHGQIHSRHNRRNHRDLDIAISYEFSGRDYQCTESHDYRMC